MAENVWLYFGQWWAVIVFVAIYAVFLAFIHLYKKSQRRPAGTFLAFVVAFAFEMFGIPFSMYIVARVFGLTLPAGVLWGHTLQEYVGDLRGVRKHCAELVRCYSGNPWVERYPQALLEPGDRRKAYGY